jgi:peptide/nickel transport system permease protein
VADLCDRVAVMRHGRVVETASTVELLRDPTHSYTRMLLDAVLDGSTVRTDPPAAVGAGQEVP